MDRTFALRLCTDTNCNLSRACMQVRVELVKSWQRHNNAQYVLKEHPELFSSFAAAYRRQCEPRTSRRRAQPARSLSPRSATPGRTRTRSPL